MAKLGERERGERIDQARGRNEVGERGDQMKEMN